MKKINYPKDVTESFSLANNNINYCVFFFKKYLSGNVLEVGAGNGDFSDKFITTKINSLTMTELDDYNFSYLNLKFALINLYLLPKIYHNIYQDIHQK